MSTPVPLSPASPPSTDAVADARGLQLCVLASGSSGNCAAVRTPGGAVVLVDAGIGPRVVAQRLAGSGAAVADVAAVCLTHLDRDHINSGWFGTLGRRGVPVYCHASRVADVLVLGFRHGVKLDVRPFGDDAFEPAAGLSATPLSFDHDAAGSHGFLLAGFGGRAGYATDLGHVPPALVDRFCEAGGVGVLAIESNYDQRMQIDSTRPWFLKRRIMGGRGHLSNAQAFDAVRRVFNRCQAQGGRPPAHVVLLHRSRQCNCPELLRALFAADKRIGPRLTLAEQDSPTPWLRAARDEPAAGEQLMLAWG